MPSVLPFVTPVPPKQLARDEMDSVLGVGMPHLSGLSESKSVIECSSSISMMDFGWPWSGVSRVYVYGMKTFLPSLRALRTMSIVEISPPGMDR